jgi:M6 family metalloprotease-like protein
MDTFLSTCKRGLVSLTVVGFLGVSPCIGSSSQIRGDGSTEVEESEDNRVRHLKGVVTVVWGDEFGDQARASIQRFFLDSESGLSLELDISPEMVEMAGGARRLNNSEVEVLVEAERVGEKSLAFPDQLTVRSLRVLGVVPGRNTEKAVTGSQPWVSLLCKFAGNSAEPKSLGYFVGMYGTSFPALDHYWRQLSYDKVNVAGSTAVSWVTLPQPVSYYYNAVTGSVNLTAMVNDCTAAADAFVYYPDYVGINLMFNATFGSSAWGGYRTMTLDSVWRLWRVTWEPPWGYEQIGVIAHEMGHGFGLPHSNNADGDGSPYDNPWDVMSDAHYYTVVDATYGRVGKGTIGYHRDILGWIDPARKLEIDSSGVYTVTLDNLALQSTSNLRLINIDIPGTPRYYTVEVRDQASYDGNLPGFAVIIHEVDPGREEEAWLVDVENLSNGADEGAMWRVGECFEDLPAEIRVCVQSVATEGFVVRVEYGDTDSVFYDDFDDGHADNWSARVP